MFGLTGGFVVLALAALREAIVELAERDERARMINQELMHRNRNQYTVITALATQTMRRAGISRDITDAMTDRILALAQAQDLISLDPHEDISLERLIDQVVAPMAPEPSRMAAHGTMVGIAADLVPGLALVFHELGTNALKHGRLVERPRMRHIAVATNHGRHLHSLEGTGRAAGRHARFRGAAALAGRS